MSNQSELAQLASVFAGSALSNRNMVINGGMTVAQRSSSVASQTSTNGYTTCDRWHLQMNSSGTFTVSQSTTAPEGFANSFKIDCTTADASPDYLILSYRFEGQDLQRIKKGTASAESLTLSFWVRSSKTGTYQVNLQDIDNTRNIGATYTISSADTWEYKTVTFAGDTTGSLDNDNANSLNVEWWLASGTTFNSGAVPTSWEAKSNADRAAGLDVAIGASISDDFYITGVQLEIGDTSTPFEHIPYSDQLARCQRYFYQLVDGANQSMGTGGYYASTLFILGVDHPVPMRAKPTASITSGTSYYRIWRNSTSEYCSLSTATHHSNSTTDHSIFDMTGDISGPVGYFGRMLSNSSSANVYLDAEL